MLNIQADRKEVVRYQRLACLQRRKRLSKLVAITQISLRSSQVEWCHEISP